MCRNSCAALETQEYLIFLDLNMPKLFWRFLKAVNKVNDILNTIKEITIPKQENEDSTNNQIFLKQQNSYIHDYSTWKNFRYLSFVV